MANDHDDIPTAGWVQRSFSGLPSIIDPLWCRQSDGQWEYGLLLEERHHNFQGVMHGGVAMAFFDQAMALTIWEACDRAFCASVEIHSQFVAAVQAPEFLRLQATILKQGNHLVLAAGEVVSEQRLVFRGSGTWSIKRPNN